MILYKQRVSKRSKGWLAISILLLCLCYEVDGYTQSKSELYNEWDKLRVQYRANRDDNPIRAMEIAAQMVTIGRQIPDDSLITMAGYWHVYQLSSLCLYDMTMKECYELIKELEHKAQSRKKLLSRTLVLLGCTYRNVKDYPRAITFFQKSKPVAVAYQKYNDTIVANSYIAECMA
jgi:hypothetical protein